MRKNKLLALILTLCMLFTTIGSISVANAADAVTEINVGQGVTYLLPDGKTYADTSKVGYRIVKGTDGVTYRVNVGEYKEIMSDNFDSYTEAEYTSGIDKNVKGGKFHLKACGTQAEGTSAYLKNDNGNTVIALGPYSTSYEDVVWTPDNVNVKDAFKVSVKIKVVDYNPSESSDTTNYFVQLRPKGTNGVFLRSKTNSSEEITATEVRWNSETSGNADIASSFEWEKSDNKYSMSDYITLSIEGNNTQYSTYINNVEKSNSQIWNGGDVTTKGLAQIQIGKTYSAEKTNAATYIDEFVYSKAVYVTDTLENVPVNTSVEQGDTSAQTTKVALNMSDGTTKDFTVNYTADTSTAGVKTADGKIDGFDGTVPVTYTVTGVSKQTINTFIGADVELADGSKADTTKLGRKYKRVAVDGAIVDYTINVGDWNIKRADDMSKHTNTTVDHDNNESTPALDIVDPTSSDGFQMSTFVNTNSTAAAVVTELADGNDVLKFTGKNPDSNVSYTLRDGFDGSFKYSMRMKIVADAQTTSSRQEAMRINLYSTTSTSEYSYFYARVLTPKTGENTLYIQPFRTNQQADAKATNVALNLNSDNKYETEWFDIVVIGKADTGTRDVYVNGVLTHRDYMKYALKTDSNVDEATKEAAKITDSTFKSIKLGKTENNTLTVYVDDVSVSSYYNFEGALPEGKEVLIGQGKAAAGELPLTFSNGIVKNIPITVSGIDTSKLGASTATAVLDGFDDTVSVNAKVCNYHINALGYKENGEYISAPKAGGTVSDAIFTNVGNYSQAKAVFAWYDSLGKLESSKIVDLSGITSGETKKINVGLQLPADITGGMLKVFVVDSLSNIIPIDVSALFTSFAATAPTVYMTGDSTTCNYKVTRFPEAGVGQMFGKYLNGASVVNMARSGYTAQQFVDEGNWDTIMNNVKPGDYIFITFGHNDNRDGSFEVCIRKFAEEADAKNANVIMYSPVARRLEALKGTAWKGFNYDGQMDFMKKYCEDNNISYIDMTTLTQNHIQTLGEDKSAQLYMVDVYNNYANYENDERWAQSMFNTEEGRTEQKLSTDNSHFTFFGADTWAQMLAKEIKNMNLVLSDYIVNTETAITYPNLD